MFIRWPRKWVPIPSYQLYHLSHIPILRLRATSRPGSITKLINTNDRLLRVFFQQDQDIAQIDVLTKLAAEIGLEQKEFKQALEIRRYKEAYQQALRHAYVDLNITSVPTFMIGKYILPGLLSRETLEQAIKAVDTNAA